MTQSIQDLANATQEALPLGTMLELKQVALVAHDLRKAIDHMLQLGVGPWETYTFDETTTTDQSYYGKPVSQVFRIALAQMGPLQWEIIQPVSGESIFADFLAQRGEGIHHLLYNREGMSLAEKDASFRAAGFRCIQKGNWNNGVIYAYYQRDPERGLTIEIVDRAPGWTRPAADEIIG